MAYNAMVTRSTPEHAEIRSLLARLDGAPADAIESETVECLSWDSNSKAKDSQMRSVREEVVAFANSRGGVILLGVSDRKRTKADALHGVGALDAMELRRSIYDGTEPRILVEIDEIVVDGVRLLAVRVPRGMPPHTTSEGLGKIRVGKESKPLIGSELSRLLLAGGQRDATIEILPEASEADIDPDQVETLRKTILAEAENREIASLPTPQLLRGLDLVREDGVTFAGILLLGKTAAISRWIPQHEVTLLKFKKGTRYEARADLRGPLLAVIESMRQFLSAHGTLVVTAGGGFRELSIPDLSWYAAREALLNAVAHRDYFLRQSVLIGLHPERFEVASPGGFLPGVTPFNLLNHPPVRRNPFLADVLQRIGLVNRAGCGVDRIYEENLRLGKGIPRYDATEAHVRLILPIRPHEAFARFVADETREGREPDLVALILLRSLIDLGQLDRWRAAEVLQDSEENAAHALARLRERGYLVSHGRGAGTGYRLVRRLSDLFRGEAATDSEIPIESEAVRLRVQVVLRDRGRLTNAEVRRISGFSRTEVLRMMKSLEAEKIVSIHGHGRGAHYLPGSRMKMAPGRK